MENPATWGRAEKAVNQAYQDWWKARAEGRIGLSLARCITDALRRENLLRDETQEELF